MAGDPWYAGEITHREEGQPRIKVYDPGGENDGGVVEVFLGGNTEAGVRDLPIQTRVWFHLRNGGSGKLLRAVAVRMTEPSADPAGI